MEVSGFPWMTKRVSQGAKMTPQNAKMEPKWSLPVSKMKGFGTANDPILQVLPILPVISQLITVGAGGRGEALRYIHMLFCKSDKAKPTINYFY